MSKFTKCPNCKEYHFEGEECEPEFTVFHPDYLSDEGRVYHAFSHHDAAIKHAERYNSCDNDLIDETIEISVCRDGITKSFAISAEPEIHFYAKEL